MKRLFITSAVVALAAAPALAHPGHILDGGYGHNHVMDYALIGGAAIAAGGWGLAALTRRFVLARLARRS